MEKTTVKSCDKYNECYSILKDPRTCEIMIENCAWFKTKQQRLEEKLSRFSK